MHDRHAAAERTEDVCHFTRDVAAAHDDQMIGKIVEAHDRVRRVIPHAIETIGYREARPRTSGDDDLVARDDVVTDLELLVPDESRRALEDRDVGGADPVIFAGDGDGIDAVEDAVTNRWPVGAVEASRDAEAGTAPRDLGDVRGVDEHLRRDATSIHARATEKVAFDDGDLPVVEKRGEHRVARTGADDDEIEVLHGQAGLTSAATWPLAGNQLSQRPQRCRARAE